MLALVDNQGGFAKTPSMGLQVGKALPVAIATVGAGVLTAAALVSGVILRSGPTAAYIDTTDTATAIIAALGDSAVVGQSFDFSHVNGVAFACTVAAGVGVTLAGITANAASVVRTYRCTVTNIAVPAVTITGIGVMTA